MRPAGAARHLSKYQNKCLRTVAGAYKITPTRILKVETYITPLNIYLDNRVAAFRQRLRISGTGRVIERAYERLKIRFRNRRERRRRVKIRIIIPSHPPRIHSHPPLIHSLPLSKTDLTLSGKSSAGTLTIINY